MEEKNITVTHRYPWRRKEIIPLVALVPVLGIIWWLASNPPYDWTNALAISMPFAIVITVIIGFLVITTLVTNIRRKNKSQLTATLNDGMLTVTGLKYEKNNKVLLKSVKEVRLQERTYHPTVRLIGGGNVLHLPKRVALVEPLNAYLRENFPANVTVQAEAKPVLNEILGVKSTAAAPVVKEKVFTPEAGTEITNKKPARPVRERATVLDDGLVEGSDEPVTEVDTAYSNIGLLGPATTAKPVDVSGVTVSIETVSHESDVVSQVGPAKKAGQRVQPTSAKRAKKKK